jgi:hypothetical protein
MTISKLLNLYSRTAQISISIARYHYNLDIINEDGEVVLQMCGPLDSAMAREIFKFAK